jgi:acetoacetyl-CoA synthetase
MQAAAARYGVTTDSYDDLHRWSVTATEDFWRLAWDECGVIASEQGERVVADKDKLPGAKYFPDAKLNFAENLLRPRADGDAIIFWGEDQVKRRIGYRDILAQVSRLQQALKTMGVKKGDRVAGFLPNMPETVIAMLAATSLGAVWSSCSPDFGVQGVLDRFGQIEPKVMIIANGYYYGGKSFDCLDKTRTIAADLNGLGHVICVPYIEGEADLSGLPGARMWDDVLADYHAGDIEYVQVRFNDPLYIMYSSGTTGKPKCIIHGVGGTLLQHLKEHMLHCDENPGDRVFYFTTCGWMMWNWLVSALASEATLLLYDGSPFHPSGDILFDFADAEGMTHFGTSAKWLDAASKAGIAPAQSHELRNVRLMMSTGSPLAPQGFDYVYQRIKTDLQLVSISGGTDILACFVGGNPLSPVWRGEIQGPMLAMDVRVFDDDGQAVTGNQGELVCINSFPSMPLGFWDDEDGRKYHAAYFDVYENIWRHGDWVEITDHGGFVIYGRSDATLNPGGVRIGTAEIYRQVEQLEEILEGLVIGQRWDHDTRVVLFVRLREGAVLDDELVGRIKKIIRIGASPRHVPEKIIVVDDIPRTLSGKITELAVTDVVHGRSVKNKSALANPEALDLFRNLPELQA